MSDPITVYYTIGKNIQGDTTISFWTKPDKKDLFKEVFIAIEESRMRFRVQNKLKIYDFILREI